MKSTPSRNTITHIGQHQHGTKLNIYREQLPFNSALCISRYISDTNVHPKCTLQLYYETMIHSKFQLNQSQRPILIVYYFPVCGMQTSYCPGEGKHLTGGDLKEQFPAKLTCFEY